MAVAPYRPVRQASARRSSPPSSAACRFRSNFTVSLATVSTLTSQPVQLQRLPGLVVEGEQHLHERAVRERPDGLQLLDELLEGHVGVLEGLQGRVAHAPEQLPERGLATQVRAQHQGVDEEADEILQRPVRAAGDRRADDDVRPCRRGAPATP